MLREMGLGGLLTKYYGTSPQRFLEANMPPSEWKMLLPWKFKTGVPMKFWKDEENHQLAFDVLRRHIGADKDVEEWYTVTQKMLHEMGLGGLLREHYGNSPQRFLEANMPPSEWNMLQPWDNKRRKLRKC